MNYRSDQGNLEGVLLGSTLLLGLTSRLRGIGGGGGGSVNKRWECKMLQVNEGENLLVIEGFADTQYKWRRILVDLCEVKKKNKT